MRKYVSTVFCVLASMLCFTEVKAGEIAAGEDHTCAIVNGSAKCWGRNDVGQLGNNSTVDKSLVPVQVEGLEEGVTNISAGREHTCAIVNGALKCWGLNDHGQVGNNSDKESHVPVQVEGLEEGVTAIFAGFHHTCAIVNGAAKCWGWNETGQLGNNSKRDSPVPVQVEGLEEGVTAIFAGFHHTCAIVNGAAKCWGRNVVGQLGNNSKRDSPVPVQVEGLEEGVTNISVGYKHTCAIVNGAAKCWGWNDHGQLGNNSTQWSFLPVEVTEYTKWKAEVETVISAKRAAKKAANRASSDPQVVADQATEDAETARGIYEKAARDHEEAKSNLASAPSNTHLMDKTKKASKTCLEAKLALDKALDFAQLKRDEARNAKIEANHKDAIAKIESSHAAELVAHKGIIKILCFPGETSICVPGDEKGQYGFRPISSVQEGDSVLSCQLEQGGNCEASPVNKVMSNTTERLIKLSFAGKELRATQEHPFYVINQKSWIAAKDLKVGDQLQSISGEAVKVDQVQAEEKESVVYNLEVHGNHNYYAEGVLVHNCDQLGILVPEEFQ